MEIISAKYRSVFIEAMKHTRIPETVTDDNVFQPANPEILPFIDRIVGDNLLPGSGIRHFENLVELHREAREGKTCLLLLEHYSNADLPAFHYLLRNQGPEGEQLAQAVVAVAGIKLNEDNPLIRTIVEAYSRLVIYPSRSMEIIRSHLTDPKELLLEMMKSRSINHAAMKELDVLKRSGRILLVFPAGTRFRPWDPGTKKGVREIDSYLKSFDRMVLVSINGNILRINPEDPQMHVDLVCPDKVVYDAGPVLDCREFRERVKHAAHFNDDKKQAVVDAVMKRLDEMHEAVEKDRLKA